MLNHLNFKEKHATLQGNFEYFEKIARSLYANLCPTSLKSRKNSHLALNSDTEVLTLMLYQNAIGVNSQRKFYRVFRTSFPEKTLLSRSRFNRRSRQLFTGACYNASQIS